MLVDVGWWSGYVTEGAAFLRKIKQGDIVKSVKVVWFLFCRSNSEEKQETLKNAEELNGW